MSAVLKYLSLEGSRFRDQLEGLDPSTTKAIPSKSSINEEDPPSPKPPPKGSNIRILSRLEAYRTAYLALTPSDNFDTALYTSVQILSGSTDPGGNSGTATFRISFPAQYCNKFGTVHGGAIATLLDGVTQCSTAVTDDGMEGAIPRGRTKGESRVGGGATKGLHVKFIRPIKVGETVRIVCEVVKCGRAGGTTIRATIRREADGEVLALCVLDKEGCERAKL